MKHDSNFTLGSLVNLVTLTVGIALGFIFGNLSHEHVHAQAVAATSLQIVDVSPTMTVGSLGTNLALAHEVDADKVVVNGIDLLLLDQNLLGYLSKRPGAENADLENVIAASKATVVHHIVSQTNQPQTPGRK